MGGAAPFPPCRCGVMPERRTAVVTARVSAAESATGLSPRRRRTPMASLPPTSSPWWRRAVCRGIRFDRRMPVLVASPACPAHFGGRRTRNRRSAGHGPGRPCRWCACGCATASGAPTPVRAPWTWLGVTPISAKPRLAPGRMEPDSPIPPAAAGSLPANSPSRKGVERRFEALEDPLPDHLAVGLSGIAGQDPDAPVPARRLAFPHGPAFGLGLPGTDHDGRPSTGWRPECRSGVRGMLPWLLGSPAKSGAATKPPRQTRWAATAAARKPRPRPRRETGPRLAKNTRPRDPSFAPIVQSVLLGLFAVEGKRGTTYCPCARNLQTRVSSTDSPPRKNSVSSSAPTSRPGTAV